MTEVGQKLDGPNQFILTFREMDLIDGNGVRLVRMVGCWKIQSLFINPLGPRFLKPLGMVEDTREYSNNRATSAA